MLSYAYSQGLENNIDITAYRAVDIRLVFGVLGKRDTVSDTANYMSKEKSMKIKICLASVAFAVAVAGAIFAIIGYKRRCAAKCCEDEAACCED